ncbi:MAG: hypothetical protein ACR2IE_09125 [Candidatus Sumerlaeaceae bacterium]
MKNARILTVALTGLMAWQSFSALAVEESHAGHNHAKDPAGSHAGHNHTGQWHNLGTTPGTGLKVTAKQLGKLESGKEGIFAVEVSGAKTPKAVRAWVGISSAEGSTKAKADKAGSGYDVHVEVPKLFPATSQLWVEIEPETGKKSKAAFSLVR